MGKLSFFKSPLKSPLLFVFSYNSLKLYKIIEILKGVAYKYLKKNSGLFSGLFSGLLKLHFSVDF